MPNRVRFAPTIAAALLSIPGTMSAQMAALDTTALAFHGFRAGAPLDEIAQHVTKLDGGRLRCERAKADRRITECRSVLTAAELGGPVELWVSAVDSVSSVLTLSGEVAGDQLDGWRRDLEKSYGRVGAKVQGPQWMMQWVRQNRMIRLTWRVDSSNKVASVSIIDGWVLDAWGKERARRAAVRST
ncbi:MAG TPA: hypothetical protein VHJ69_11460 [Gemmatimonadales bacterium]|jgi:hypothetical protein|nr:hypothetical protein [Gemmatimonadales bacterium]